MTNVRLLLSTLACAVLFINSSNAQIFFTETFEGTMGANGIPTGWTETGLSTDGIWNVNTSAVASSPFLTYPAPASGTRFAYSNDDACNCNKSADRMIMPAQNFTGMVGVNLIFNGYLNGGYGETGVVQVSTNGGTTWATVYTLAANPAAWQNNLTVNLNAYAGQTNVLISFLYSDNNDWAYGIGIDDVRLEQLTALLPEVGITSVNPGQYTVMPANQVTSFAIGATVNNSGSAAAANVTLTTNVFKLPNTTTPVYTGTGSTANLAAGATATINAATAFTPAAPVAGEYIFQSIISGNTGSTANDTAFYGLFVADSTYARDDATVSAALGITGQGNEGILGNTYDINTNSTLTSVLFATNGVGAGPAVGDTTQVLIYATTAGVPTGAPIATSAFYIYTATDTGAVVRTVAINGSTGLAVTAGTKIFVALKEFPRTDNLGILVSEEIWTPNTSFGSVNGGAWTPLETFGFPNPVLIRANLRQVCNLTATTTSTNATCTGGTGSATVTPASGTTPYVFNWSNGQTNATANNLVAGNYTVTVTDNTGCSVTRSVTVSSTSTTITTATPTTTNSACGGATGSASVNPTNGTAPYVYAWSNGGNTQTIVNIAAGSYTVTVTDANGCVGTVSGIIVNNPNAPTASISAFTAVACNGGATGQATAAASGGTAPYTFIWSNGANTAAANGLVAGVYTATVTDAASCLGVTSVTITQPTALAVTANASATANVSCFGGNNGAAGVAAAGGTPNYTYVWSNGGNTATITGLTAGTYTATVTDANLCNSTLAITVTQPASALSVTANSTDILCNGATNGTATATGAGGTAPYSYTWSNGANGAAANGLAAGTYSVTATDANGCVADVAGLTVTEPSALNVGITVTDASAFGVADGSVNIAVGGGTGTYTYLWSNGATTEDLTGVVAGTYTVTVTDANGCSDTEVGTVDQPSTVGATNANINISVFPNPADASATLSINLVNSSDVIIEITNVTGQLISVINDAAVLNNNYTLNTSEWAAGVYFVRVTAGNDTATYRVTKK
jgi:trimeric autotransporter adhesin